MHTSLAVISRYTVLPECSRAARRLLDEVGIEVKRIDHSLPGVPITVELLANRGDHYCVTGLAREVHGRTGKGLCLPRTHELTIGEAAIPVRRVSERCTNYTATLLVRDGEEGALPEDVLGLLEAAGLESKGAVVDATNVASIELGQPTHAFDAGKIVGRAPHDITAEAFVACAEIKFTVHLHAIDATRARSTGSLFDLHTGGGRARRDGAHALLGRGAAPLRRDRDRGPGGNTRDRRR